MEQYIGQILMVGFNFAPIGWALCNGQLLSIAQYTALFSLLGTTYGGDGISNFALPNLQGRVPVHQGLGSGLSPYVIGNMGGSENVALLTTQVPSHNHLINVSNTPGAAPDPTNNIQAEAATGDPRNPTLISQFTAASPTGTMAPSTVSMTGGGQPHANIQPYLTINFIIALQGIFPARN
jgi:microcystin-dependent protein